MSIPFLRFLFCCSFFAASLLLNAQTPVHNLLERIDKGASSKFIIEKASEAGDKSYFELDQRGSKVVVRGDNYVSIATGINWYLKNYANIHLSWNGMHAKLPARLPKVARMERHECCVDYRYYLNYCTYSYTMAFWDWKRWEQEIDWMALHGINMPLALIGTSAVWANVLEKLGYSKDEINEFVAGPAFQAWWLMNNLEGWGGPNPDSFYRNQVELQKKILERFREYGIDPVFPGYSGMVPRNIAKKKGWDVADPGTWCALNRPALLQPTDEHFNEMADLYYSELENLFGKAKYYSMDPFHEGAVPKGVDLDKTFGAIASAMKRANPNSKWVIQSWGRNPLKECLQTIKKGDLIVLDLFSDGDPKWQGGYEGHDWIFCMLQNFGGRMGIYGHLKGILDGFASAREKYPATLVGVGATPEAIESNPVTYEMLFDLPWYNTLPDKLQFLDKYVSYRYGKSCPELVQAWKWLSNKAYDCTTYQQGSVETVICARPKKHITSASTWGNSKLYYNPSDIQKAVRSMISVSGKYKGNNNYCYDLVDFVRQCMVDKANGLHGDIEKCIERRDTAGFDRLSNEFLSLILDLDKLLGTRSEFMVGSWISQARSMDAENADWYEWNARTLITVWGNKAACNMGGLLDYSNRQWEGLMRDYYYPRWKAFFATYRRHLVTGNPVRKIDYFKMEEGWSKDNKAYSNKPAGNSVKVAEQMFNKYFN